MRDAVSPLVDLGFTELEAAIYTYLVQHSPATGYRIAHDIGRPMANTYKAVESLHQRGVVMVDESGDNRLVRAIPPAELLRQLKKTFTDRHEEAREVLARLEPADRDVGLYSLTQVEQVFARAQGMLERAEKIVVADLFPAAVERLRDRLESTAAKGVAVAARVYEPTDVAGVELMLSPGSERVMELWPGQWLNLVVDGAEFLISILSDDLRRVHQAVWTGSPFVAMVYHIALSHELVGARMAAVLARDDASLEEIRGIAEDVQRFAALGSVGYRALTRALQAGSPAAEPAEAG